MDWNQTYLRGKNYAAGFMQGARMYASLTPVPLRSRAAAIVCVSSDSSDLHRVLSQLEALPLHEIVLVLSQPTDGIFALARSRKNTLIVHLPDSVEPDVGRALGAKLTDADTLLFVDGKQATDANVLARFLWECDGRMDIALNDISARMGLFKQRGGIEQFHEFLNSSLNRQDLRANSMSVLPIAMSRHALDTLGSAVLAVPVKAHAIAILNKLRIGAGGSAGSGTLKEQSKSKEHLKKAAGDHVEALKEAMTTRGSRLQFVDTIRNRSVLGDER
ncbi:family 2 glycosyl transferase [Cohnella sp.]|uniref:family 2 glycosyl transferase n=1 Tax=Cohnella sp. TaxID=1883426 RepID=UPI003566B7AE